VADDQAVIPAGEAIAGRLLNGLGCAHRPWSWTPPFCASTPRELLGREGLAAELCNRVTRGRTLDEAQAYGCDLWCQERALAIGAQERLDLRCHHLDTTSVARRGASVPARDEHASTSPHGSCSDHRPDLKPAVLALRGSHEGGVPVVRKHGDGPTSDREMFQARAQALMTAFTHAPSPRSLRADATRDQADNAPNRRALGLIPRLPTTLGPVSPVITHALTWETWHPRDETTRDQRLELCHEGMAPRWRVVHSPAALARAEPTGNTAQPRASETLARPLFHLHATRFPTPEAAQDALGPWAPGWTDPPVDASRRPAPQRETGKGRPTPKTPLQASEWHIDAHVRPEDEALRRQTHGKACCGLGTTSGASPWRDTEVMAADNGPARGEGGCRGHNDPLVLVASLWVQTPSRVQGLWRVTT
jgi:hypothetical protein